MSAIPPNWMASSIQAHGAADRAAESRRREKAEASERSGEADSADLENVIENAGRDSEVYSDAEGSGSQGRPSGEADQDPNEPEQESTPGAGLDVEA